MLAKKNRLSRLEIQKVIKKGKRFNFGFLSFKILANQFDFARFAVVVPKSLVKKATERNRLRRIMFEELKQYLKINLDVMVRIYQLPENEKILREKVKETFSKINV